MNIDLNKEERAALNRLLLIATNPFQMVNMKFRPYGEEFRVAMKVTDELRRLGSFDPDCDKW